MKRTLQEMPSTQECLDIIKTQFEIWINHPQYEHRWKLYFTNTVYTNIKLGSNLQLLSLPHYFEHRSPEVLHAVGNNRVVFWPDYRVYGSITEIFEVFRDS